MVRARPHNLDLPAYAGRGRRHLPLPLVHGFPKYACILALQPFAYIVSLSAAVKGWTVFYIPPPPTAAEAPSSFNIT
jgi:hypothetical protein